VTKPTYLERQYGVLSLHPSRSFSAPSYREPEPALRRHIERLRPDWDSTQVDAEVDLWRSRQPAACRQDAPQNHTGPGEIARLENTRGIRPWLDSRGEMLMRQDRKPKTLDRQCGTGADVGTGKPTVLGEKGRK
jgi:hypothetical protein